MRILTTPHDTAVLLAVLLARSNQTRARFSDKTLRFLGGRKHLHRNSFVKEVTDALAENHGWFMTPLTVGGYGAAKETALMAGKTVTPKRLLEHEELRKLKRRELTDEDWEAFYDEVLPEETPFEED